MVDFSQCDHRLEILVVINPKMLSKNVRLGNCTLGRLTILNDSENQLKKRGFEGLERFQINWPKVSLSMFCPNKDRFWSRLIDYFR